MRYVAIIRYANALGLDTRRSIVSRSVAISSTPIGLAGPKRTPSPSETNTPSMINAARRPSARRCVAGEHARGPARSRLRLGVFPGALEERDARRSEYSHSSLRLTT